MPKSDFASEELARNKLAKDLTKAYNKLALAQPDIEGKPQILIEMLGILKIFKEIKQSTDIQLDTDPELFAKNLGLSVGSTPKMGPDSAVALSEKIETPIDSVSQSRYGKPNAKIDSNRKENEQICCVKMWKILSYGGREVTKEILTSLLHTLLTIDESLSFETKLEMMQESAKISGGAEELNEDFKIVMHVFSNLSKEVKTSRYLTHFAQKLKLNVNPREEKEAKECTFAPSINQKSRKIDVKLKTEKEKERSGSQEKQEEPKVLDAGKKFVARQRSTSPPRHQALYENYKEIQSKVQKKKEEIQATKEKELTFKPKISKAANKFNEDSITRVFFYIQVNLLV